MLTKFFGHMSRIGERSDVLRRSAGAACSIETLEARQLLSTIAWDGGSDGSGANLLDPLNWAGDVLPGPGDDVTIGATGSSPALTLAGVFMARNLTSNRAIQVNSGGNLTLSGSADQSATLTLNLGTLTGGAWNMGSQVVNLMGNGTSALVNTDVRGTVRMAVTTGVNLSPGTRFTLLSLLDNTVGTVQFASNYVLQDAIVSGINSTLHIGQPAEVFLTIAPSGSMSVAGNFDIGNSTLTNYGSITAVGQGYLRFTVNVTNNGTITTNSGLIATGPYTFQNLGTLNLSGSRGADFETTVFRNLGEINVLSEVRIRSNITTADLHAEGIHNTTGAIGLLGTVNNANASFHVTAQLGLVYLSGATLQGGTLDIDPDARLGIGAGGSVANSLLRDVQVTNPLMLGASTAIRLAGSVTFPSMQVTNGTVTLDGYELNSPITFTGIGGNSNLVMNDNATASIGALAVVRLEQGATGDLFVKANNSGGPASSRGLLVQAATGRSLYLAGNWINDGEVRALTGNLKLDNNGTFNTIVNRGLVRAQGGSVLTFQVHDWFNPGTVSVENSSVVLSGIGHLMDFNYAGFTTVNSPVSVTGTLDNLEAVFPITPATNAWTYTNAVISGGVMSTSGSLALTIPLSSSLTLRDIQINTEIQTNGRLTLEGSTRSSRVVILSTGGLTLGIGYTLRDEVVITGPGTFSRSVGFSASSSIGSSGVVRVDATATGAISIGGGISHGLIVNDSAVTLQILNGTLVNYGTIRANAGSRILIFTGTTVLNPGLIDIQGGTVEIDGTVQGSEFNGPGVTNVGGVFSFAGTLNNAGNTLSLPNAGSITLLPSAIINGGTIALSPGANVIIAAPTNNVTLNGVIIQADVSVTLGNVFFTGASRFSSLHLRGTSTVNFPAGYTLRDNIIADGADVGVRNVVFPSTGAATIASGVVVELAADAAGDLVVTGGSSAAVPFANAGTFHAVSPTNRLRILGPAFTSSGTLQVDGGSMSVESTVWSSSGQINANGGALAVIGTWTSFGSINLQNASTTLGGSFTTAGLHLASFTRSGGTLAISANWANNAQTIDLAATLGSIVLIGAHISGGTLIPSAAATITIVGSGAEFSNVQVSGDIIANNTGALTVRGTTRFGTLFLRGVSSVTFDTIFTFQDRVVADGTAVGLRSIFIPNSGSLTISPTGSIALASNSGGDLSVRPGTGTTTLVNNGQIIAGGNTALTISATNFTNNALMSVSSGRLAFTTGTMTSLGQFVVSGGTLSLGGTFNTTGFDSSQMTRTGGTVELAGTLANTGRTLTLNIGTGSWVLNAATISSGQIILNNGVTLNATTGTTVFQGASIQGDVIAFSGAVISMQPGTRFTTLRLHGTAIVDLLTGFTLFDAITAEGPETGTRTLRMLGATSGTIGATGSIRLAADSGGDFAYSPSSGIVLSNAGLISNDSATRVLTLRVNPLNNTGTIQAVGGAIQITGAVSNIVAGVLTGGTWRVADGGSITGLAAITANTATIILDGSGAILAAISGLQSNTGTISLGGVCDATFAPAGGTFTQSGTLSLDAGSHLHISGAFVQTGTGQLLIRVAGTSASQIGSVTASGVVTLDGGLTITFTPGYTPVKLDGFDVVLGSTISGTFSSVVLPPPLPVGKNFILYNAGSVRFVVSSLADTNSDGLVDFFDYLDFVSAFSINDPSADFNGDGGIDFFDYLDFINEFSQF